MSESIDAIPTSFNGIRFRSRLEARFAEMLTLAGAEFEYEKQFPGYQGYIPDFFLPAYGLYVEIKPERLLKETEIFYPDVRGSACAWICVDNAERGKWRVIAFNASFRNGTVYGPTEITFHQDRMILQVEHLEFLPISNVFKDEKPEFEPEVPASEETAREYFARMRAFLEK